MTKTFCDRCGKETARWKLFTILTGSVKHEVCADCKEAFWRFMRDGKESEAEKC